MEETLTLKERVLSPEQEKIYQTPYAFYDYLKNLYGIAGSENLQTIKKVEKTVELSFPTLPKDSSGEGAWMIRIEENWSIFGSKHNRKLTFGFQRESRTIGWKPDFELMATIGCKYMDRSGGIPGSENNAYCSFEFHDMNLYPREGRDSLAPIFNFMNLINVFLAQY